MTFDLEAATTDVAAAARANAISVDTSGSFPAQTIDAARQAGLF